MKTRKQDELMQTMDQVITLQDKIITRLRKDLHEYKSGRSPFNRLFVPKPAHTDEERLDSLKAKISELKIIYDQKTN